MTLDAFFGTYERTVSEDKFRICLPKPWNTALDHLSPFYLYQPLAGKCPIPVLHVIPESYLHEEFPQLLTGIRSPFVANEQEASAYFASLGDLLSNLAHLPYNPSKGQHPGRITIPRGGTFTKIIPEDRRVMLIGLNNYFSIYAGSLETVLDNLKNFRKQE